MLSSQFDGYQAPKMLSYLHLNVPGNGLDCVSEHVIPSGFWGPQAILFSPPTLFQMEKPVAIIFKILEAILFMCESHFKCLCIVNPKKLNFIANSILIFLISIFGILTCS